MNMTAVQWDYRALDPSGEAVSGSVTASSEPEAAGIVRHLGLRPTELRVTRMPIHRRDFSLPTLERKVQAAEVASSVRQLSTMLRSGVSIVRSLTVLADQTSNPTLEASLQAVRTDVESGVSLSAAFARHPRSFGPVFVALVRAGETGGALDTVLDQAADNLERQAELKRKIRSTLAYPISVLVLVAGVLLGMSVFVVPVFRDVYADLGHNLPLVTTVVLAVTGFVGKNALFIVGGALLLGVGAKRWRATETGRRITDRAVLKIPVVGELIRQAALARAARSLAVLSGAGVPLLQALDITASTVGNETLGAVIRDAADAIRTGRNLSDPLLASPEIPALFAQVIAVGEESGELDEMLQVVAEVFDDGVEAVSATVSGVIEPVMIAGLGAVVGGLVLSLYLPMFRLVDIVQ